MAGSEDNKGPITIIVSSVMTGLGLLLVIGRITSRRISGRKLAVDDYIVVFAIILNITYVALSGVAVGHGAGQHVYALDPESIKNAIYFNIVAFVPGVLSFTIPKFAVLILLFKLLDPGLIHKRIMSVLSVIYGLIIIVMLVINFAQCTPAAAQWGGAKGTCWPRKITFGYSLMVGIVSAMFDFYLALFPTIVLLRLNMGWKKKLGLASALGFGYCAGSVTVYKCTTLVGFGDVEDFTWNTQGIVLWTNIEANCVLIGACIPTLYPIMKKVFGATVLRTARSREGTSRGSLTTFGASDKNRRRLDDLSVLEMRDISQGNSSGGGSSTGPEHGGENNSAMAETQGSWHSGETTMRYNEKQAPVEDT